jgi:crossover junction endodeoxyribonuclease RuvC
MFFVGFDPGITGAIAVLLEDRTALAVYDMPVMAMGKHHQVNAAEVRRLLLPLLSKNTTSSGLVAYIEQVSSMPGNGSVSMFNFGMSYGTIIGVCAALQIPITFVRPNAWKKAAGLINKPKEAARTLAQLFYPGVDLSLKKHVGRADALLIARFGGLC